MATGSYMTPIYSRSQSYGDVSSEDLEIACLLRNPKVSDWTSAGVDRFPVWKNRRSTCHRIIQQIKEPLRINLDLVLSVKLNYGNI
ncbi:hypothetical protein TNCV_2402291 [Trichonephila clavipes]|nr:hypothetical protein TNCV_2402291 [Trichonephila clavipes]